MSVVEKDKLANTALIRNCRKVSLSTCIPICFILGDDVNADKEAPTYKCVVDAGNCILCIVHSDRNSDRKYYYCREKVGDYCHTFKWAD
jgi:hypothetical protein